ncbi:hypothetical protein T492DRAFT_428550 [Pavlovales sp. CCMP2436]|nr:hypothetical protein T492DRAFT_428550 [Pavlovales sp. CCMP2436]
MRGRDISRVSGGDRSPERNRSPGGRESPRESPGRIRSPGERGSPGLAWAYRDSPVPGRELTDKPGRVRERDNLGAYRDSPGTYRDSPGAYQDSPGAYRDSPGSAACSLSRPIRSLSVGKHH